MLPDIVTQRSSVTLNNIGRLNSCKARVMPEKISRRQSEAQLPKSDMKNSKRTVSQRPFYKPNLPPKRDAQRLGKLPPTLRYEQSQLERMINSKNVPTRLSTEEEQSGGLR